MRDPLPKADDYYMNPVASIFGFRKGSASDVFLEIVKWGGRGRGHFQSKNLFA